MNFTDIFIKRPIFASAINLILMIAGIIAMMQMSIREYPDINLNAITISTAYPGASANLVSGFVTTQLETVLGQLSDVDYMYSNTWDGNSQIVLYLKLGADVDAAVANTQAQVSRVLSNLPPGVQYPEIQKTDANSSPSMIISYETSRMSPEQLTDYLLRVVQPQLETLPGVQQARIFGKREYAMRLNVDPFLMAAHNITPEDLANSISDQNYLAAAGTIESPLTRYDIVASTDIHTVKQFDNMLVGKKGDSLVSFKEIGKAFLGAKDYSVYPEIDGKQLVAIGIYTYTDANTLQVSHEVYKALASIKAKLPQGLSTRIVIDNAIFIQASIDEVMKTIVEAVVFVVLVILLFLGSLRAVLIPIVTIPLSIFGVSTFMLAMGYSINTITLLAWVLAIGLVVDDAIVVVENIHRHIEDGKSPLDAALLGAKEIRFAVIAMTLTLAAVYAPIGFSTGLTGALFSEFAFTLAAAVIVSGFVALTLSPTMCARLLKPQQSKFSISIDKGFDRLQQAYEKLLHAVMTIRPFIIFAVIVTLFTGVYIIKNMPAALAPTEDQGQIQTVIVGPANANIKYMAKFGNMISKVYQHVPEMANNVVISGIPSTVNSGISKLRLIKWDKRQRSASDILSSIAPKLWNIAGVKVYPFLPPPLPSAGKMPLEFVIKTTGINALPRLLDVANKTIAAANKYPGIQHLNADLYIDKPQLNVKINRRLAFTLGVSSQQIGQALSLLFGQPQKNQLSINNRGYYVIPELAKNFNYDNDPNSINNIYVRSEGDKLLPLSTFVTISTHVDPRTINHFAQLPSVTLQGAITPGYTIGQAVTFLTDYINTHFNNNYLIDYSGQTRQYIQASGSMEQAFIFAIIFIFLVLAAQFESLRDPLVVMVTVPLSITGAVATLFLAGGTLNIYSEIGLITLIGLITKHGILIVEFTNQIRATGKPLYDSVIQASCLRLRPILMTTAAMVCAGFPLALATGAGAQARHQLGWVIVGGMVMGTLFSLFVIPTVYSYIAKQDKGD